MNKTEIINQIAEKAHLIKKDSEKTLNAFIKTVSETLKSGDDIQLVSFGSFQVKPRAAREGLNPQTGKVIQIAAANVPSFKTGKTLKEAVK
ncbi:DNA-binding protein HU [Arsenophonus endosymbiont of Aleurodicus floccissimus]|uniref:HU family DNA-binding protein n=1 Tax=Arsenophonus endosymbiont of Aleurodicus floccissimus TaxID=2152761 RepID=UPI000E6B1CEE|nr:HU family DNA-binding protein [Arsenophonus endosymbiont of Aleurodicus floccissimus]SPP32652.1 DNA-binding protein HU [Arsenophonus endosymbiont of Aleurodicus floccissimus]